MAFKLTVNGKAHEVDVPDDKPLLWVLREDIGLTGTKFACGIARCGACTVHLDGRPMRSCVTPVSAVGDRAITTVEGVESPAAMAMLESNPQPSDEDIDSAMRGNLCRCATYHRIRAAIHRAASELEA